MANGTIDARELANYISNAVTEWKQTKVFHIAHFTEDGKPIEDSGKMDFAPGDPLAPLIAAIAVGVTKYLRDAIKNDIFESGITIKDTLVRPGYTESHIDKESAK
jgi:hypothetical protein